MTDFSSPAILALIGTAITFAATALGAATVFLVKSELKGGRQKAMLGFASGIMIAASVWSLLLPAIDMAAKLGDATWLPAALGFAAGGMFLYLLDRLLPHLHTGSENPEGVKTSFRRVTLLVLAVTLHNIPEGMAVGFSFALASSEPAALAGAAVLAAGMALQNFPEGAAVSLPLRAEGFSKGKAFIYGAASGAVELVSGVLGAVLAAAVEGIMPFMLSFAAGAMIYVVVEELVPEAHSRHSHIGTLSAMAGFVIMMAMDIAFGS